MFSKIAWYILCLLLFSSGLCAQRIAPYHYEGVYHPTLLVKSDLLLAATGSFNLTVETALDNHLSLEVGVSYNNWLYGSDTRLKHILLRPELRYWPKAVFNGWFVGFHVHGGQFNMGGLKLGSLRHYRHQGDFYGGGVSAGYHHWITGRWALEFTLGVGYTYLDYERFRPEKNGKLEKRESRHYTGPDKAGISVIFLLK